MISEGPISLEALKTLETGESFLNSNMLNWGESAGWMQKRIKFRILVALGQEMHLVFDPLWEFALGTLETMYSLEVIMKGLEF